METPQNIFIAPLDILNPELQYVFMRMGYGVIPMWTQHGCAMFVHIDSKTIKDCRHAAYSVKLELHEIEKCPLIRFDITIYDNPFDPLRMDCFLNINRKDHLPAIEALTEQEIMAFHWYNENFKYIRSTKINWPEEQRKMAKIIIQNAREIIKRTGGGDFDKAKQIFIQNNTL